ncbi:GNAT family N-acetyltransferase [Candidatus Bipolaricaulota bacterium]|nr:GNAT family N-acetyltransferase [Candidatus Bipolaricaulota bacterium]
MKTRDADKASDLVARSFRRSLASNWPATAVREFERYIEAAALERRVGSHHQHWVAEKDGAIVGVLELRQRRQITLFFVDQKHRGSGIGGRLLHAAERGACFGEGSDQSVFYVHACFPAVPIYVRLGFRPTGRQKTRNGLVFTTLERVISNPGTGG